MQRVCLASNPEGGRKKKKTAVIRIKKNDNVKGKKIDPVFVRQVLHDSVMRDLTRYD